MIWIKALMRCVVTTREANFLRASLEFGFFTNTECSLQKSSAIETTGNINGVIPNLCISVFKSHTGLICLLLHIYSFIFRFYFLSPAKVSFSKKLQARPAILFKKRLWHRSFPVNFAKFLRTPFLHKTSGRLLL